jgi:hypothetical protein
VGARQRSLTVGLGQGRDGWPPDGGGKMGYTRRALCVLELCEGLCEEGDDAVLEGPLDFDCWFV